MPPWLIRVSRIFYALGLIGIGVQHFIFADFIPVIVPAFPPSIPGRSLLAYAAGAALVAAGAAILLSLHARTVGAITGAAFLLLVIFAHVPTQLAGSPGRIAVWSNTLKALTLCGGAWLVAGSLDQRNSSAVGPLERLMPFGRFFLPITVIVFGIEHFVYKDFVATLVPSWVPGSHFWTYFTGFALISSGIAIIVKFQARLAALLLGLMIFLWFIMLHIPRAIADPSSGRGNEWTSVFEALAFSGIPFIMASLPASSRFSVTKSEPALLAREAAIR